MNETTESSQNYSVTMRILHWFMALLIIANFIIGDTMSELPEDADKTGILLYHSGIGLLVFLFVFFRGGVRLSQSVPEALGSGLQLLAAKATHILLYVLMLLMPVSGLLCAQSEGETVGFFGLFNLPNLVAKNQDLHEIFEEIHETGFIILLILVILHIAAAIYHQYFLHDGILNRMTHGKSPQK